MPQRLSNTVAEELKFELESDDSFPLDVLYENDEHAAGLTIYGQFTQKGLSSGSLFPIPNAGDRLQQTDNATSPLNVFAREDGADRLLIAADRERTLAAARILNGDSIDLDDREPLVLKTCAKIVGAVDPDSNARVMFQIALQNTRKQSQVGYMFSMRTFNATVNFLYKTFRQELMVRSYFLAVEKKARTKSHSPPGSEAGAGTGSRLD